MTVVGHADEIASAASILMGQASEARPVDSGARPGRTHAAPARRRAHSPGHSRIYFDERSRGRALRRRRWREARTRACAGAAARRADRDRQHRRRFSAPRPAHLARPGFGDVRAGRALRSRSAAGAAATRLGVHGSARQPRRARRGFSSATRISRCMWSARGGSRKARA